MGMGRRRKEVRGGTLAAQQQPPPVRDKRAERVEWEFSLSMDSIFSPSLRDFASEGRSCLCVARVCGGWEELISASNTLRRCRGTPGWSGCSKQPASLCQSRCWRGGTEFQYLGDKKTNVLKPQTRVFFVCESPPEGGGGDSFVFVPLLYTAAGWCCCVMSLMCVL